MKKLMKKYRKKVGLRVIIGFALCTVSEVFVKNATFLVLLNFVRCLLSLHDLNEYL